MPDLIKQIVTTPFCAAVGRTSSTWDDGKPVTTQMSQNDVITSFQPSQSITESITLNSQMRA